MRVNLVHCLVGSLLLHFLQTYCHFYPFSRFLAYALPSGFEEQDVASIKSITDFEFTPDGKMLVITKEGKLYLVDDPQRAYDRNVKPKLLLDIGSRLCLNGERGLSGVTVHPNFLSNRYVYLFYNFNIHNNCDVDHVPRKYKGPVNRMSRFLLPKGYPMIDKDTEKVLLQTEEVKETYHNSGDMAFGVDGYLYVSLGDGGARTDPVSQRLDNILGSIVRVNGDGVPPKSNPFTDSDSVRCYKNGVPPSGSPKNAKCQEIYAYGLRNPWRFSLDSNAAKNGEVRFYIGDVGSATWEEISEGGQDFKGANYGWPIREGPCYTDKTSNCGFPSKYQDPLHWDIHSSEGGAITGGAFIPKGVWPGKYDGKYLYTNYIDGKIYLLEYEGKGCDKCNPPKSDYNPVTFEVVEKVASMMFGPYKNTQALYYASRAGNGWIRRVVHVNSGQNSAPDAEIVASKTTGPEGTVITFDGTRSSDRDDDKLSYEWDFNGDGKVDSTSAKTTYKYTKKGTYIVSLTVKDGKGGEDTAFIEIDIGSKPKAVITNPKEGTKFAVGDKFVLTGYAEDSQGNRLPSSSLTWEVRQHHSTHYHPFMDETKGNNIKPDAAPGPEEFSAATNSYLEILLTAEDQNGLLTTVTRDLKPKIVYLEFDTEPSGLEVILDGISKTTPIRVASWENHQLSINAPDQKGYDFKSWNTGAEQSHYYIVSKSSPAEFVATFDGDSNVPPTNPNCNGSTLKKGNNLLRGQLLCLDDELFGLTTSGDLAYWIDDKIVWSAGVNGADHIRMQKDGNLVVKDQSSGSGSLWTSNDSDERLRNKLPDADLTLNGDGVSIVTPSSVVLWKVAGKSTPTPPRSDDTCKGSTLKGGKKLVSGESLCLGQERFGISSSGDLVYWNNDQVVWNAGISGATAFRMQTDGNLIAFDKDQPIWSSNDSPEKMRNKVAGGQLTLEGSGASIVLSSSNTVIWKV